LVQAQPLNVRVTDSAIPRQLGLRIAAFWRRAIAATSGQYRDRHRSVTLTDIALK
jgi:hypothetical protein